MQTTADAVQMTEPPKRRSNLRTALVMVSIAAVFFFGVIADHLIAKHLGIESTAGASSAGARR